MQHYLHSMKHFEARNVFFYLVVLLLAITIVGSQHPQVGDRVPDKDHSFRTFMLFLRSTQTVQFPMMRYLVKLPSTIHQSENC